MFSFPRKSDQHIQKPHRHYAGCLLKNGRSSDLSQLRHAFPTLRSVAETLLYCCLCVIFAEVYMETYRSGTVRDSHPVPF